MCREEWGVQPGCGSAAAPPWGREAPTGAELGRPTRPHLSCDNARFFGPRSLPRRMADADEEISMKANQNVAMDTHEIAMTGFL